MNSEIENLIEKINIEEGCDLKLNTRFGKLENIYFDTYEEYPKISPRNTLKLYHALSLAPCSPPRTCYRGFFKKRSFFIP